MLDKRAKWIWINNNPDCEEYAFFKENFEFRGKKTTVKIVAETDFILYINGKRVAFGQFAGFKNIKYFEEFDITEFCKAGQNSLEITVRYEGVNSFTHIEDGAGVIFTVSDDELLAYSGTHTLCGYDNRYLQHNKRFITMQLGFAPTMKQGDFVADKNAVLVEKNCEIVKRPIKRHKMLPFAEAMPLANKKNVYDLGRETVGYLYLAVKTEKPQTVKVAYGEHIDDGNVRYMIGERNFSLDFQTGTGVSEFTECFLKVAGRYLEVFAEDDAEIISIGLMPIIYPVTEKTSSLTGLDKRIYDTSVRTLRLCMGNHYEDCPWREQALYVVDSINQMLCGYYAFEETEFQRESLLLIPKSVREDGLLEIVSPSVNTPAIPFFSVMYPVAVYDYIKHTGDKTVLKEVFPACIKIMENFKNRIDENGLIREFNLPYWNFYEWNKGFVNPPEPDDVDPPVRKYHLILNCAFLYSFVRFKYLCEMENTDFSVDIEKMKAAINKEFLNEETGLFYLWKDDEPIYTQLGNAFALLVGLGDERTVRAIKDKENLVPATLSMAAYVYNALLKFDENEKDYILNDIRENYKYMLDCGATSFWETIKGQKDFDNAGSLCHGWSAMPVYYYNLFGMV